MARSIRQVAPHRRHRKYLLWRNTAFHQRPGNQCPHLVGVVTVTILLIELIDQHIQRHRLPHRQNRLTDLFIGDRFQLRIIQHRQYRRNLRAQPRTVPLIQGRAAVVAPLATGSVVAAYKPRAAVVLADSGAAVQVASSRKGPAVAGNGNTTTTSTEHWARPFVPWVIGAVGAVGLYLLWPWLLSLLRRRRAAE